MCEEKPTPGREKKQAYSFQTKDSFFGHMKCFVHVLSKINGTVVDFQSKQRDLIVTGQKGQ